MSPWLRVAIIGAGPAGLFTLRHLKGCHSDVEVVVFEQLDDFGGLWYYREDVNDPNNHPSVYRTLKTNIPKEVMQLTDFPFKESDKSYPSAKEVKKYLTRFAKKYDLVDHIQFNTRVVSVDPDVKDGGHVKWVVTSQNQNENTTKVDVFDVVIVCSGHFVNPYWPDLPDLDQFKGSVIHSKYYRSSETFAGQKVVCIGAGFSGKDISQDLLRHASCVYLINKNKPLQGVIPDRIYEKPEVARVTPHGVELVTGERLAADAIIMCTGYRYKFPYLSPQCQISTNGKFKSPKLWKHLIHPHLPSLFFIGIPKLVCTFPLFDCQARFISLVLAGKIPLPNETEMLDEIEAETRHHLARGMPVDYHQYMGDAQWAYQNHLADMGGFNHVPNVYFDLFHHSLKQAKSSYYTYRGESYLISKDNKTFETISP